MTDIFVSLEGGFITIIPEMKKSQSAMKILLFCGKIFLQCRLLIIMMIPIEKFKIQTLKKF